MYALLANPNKHFYTSRKNPVKLIVLHVTAGLEDLDMQGADHSAEGTNRYGASVTRAASWHKCVDSDSIADALPDEYTAFHVQGYNSTSLGLEISNKDARWDNKPAAWVEATLLNAARVCLAWEKKFGVPRRLLSKAQVDAGLKGYSYHMFLDPTRRRDPGATFPWDRFVQILSSLESDGVPPAPAHDPHVPKPYKPLHVAEDGDFGPATKARLQESLNMTGAKPPLKIDGDFGPATKRALQLRLNHVAGPVTADGVFGPRSTRALQRHVGVGQDGKWGPGTTRALQRKLNAGTF